MKKIGRIEGFVASALFTMALMLSCIFVANQPDDHLAFIQNIPPPSPPQIEVPMPVRSADIPVIPDGVFAKAPKVINVKPIVIAVRLEKGGGAAKVREPAVGGLRPTMPGSVGRKLSLPQPRRVIDDFIGNHSVEGPRFLTGR